MHNSTNLSSTQSPEMHKRKQILSKFFHKFVTVIPLSLSPQKRLQTSLLINSLKNSLLISIETLAIQIILQNRNNVQTNSLRIKNNGNFSMTISSTEDQKKWNATRKLLPHSNHIRPTTRHELTVRYNWNNSFTSHYNPKSMVSVSIRLSQ